MALTSVITCANADGHQNGIRSLIVADVARGGQFLRWLSAKLLGDIYPGAPNERKVFAALLLNDLIEVWCYQGDLNTGKLRRKHSQEKGSQAHRTDRLNVIGPELAQAASSLAVLGEFLERHTVSLWQQVFFVRCRGQRHTVVPFPMQYLRKTVKYVE